MSVLPCRDDALVSVLNQHGYNPLLLPRSGIEPPEIYIYDNDTLRRWGRLATSVPKGSLPAELNGGDQADISHSESSRKSLSAAGSFLADALRCIGVTGAPKLDLSFAQGYEVTFSFSGVTWRGLDPADIGAALRAGFEPGAIPAEQVQLGLVHIAYDYAYARSLRMTVAATGKSSLDLNAVKIEGFVDLGGKAEVEVASRSSLLFKGKGKPAAFACKIGQVRRVKGAWTFDAFEVLGHGFAPDEGHKKPYLLRRGMVLVAQDQGGE